jgi:hypothetical protein
MDDLQFYVNCVYWLAYMGDCGCTLSVGKWLSF